MFRDESFSGGAHSSPPPRENSPPQSPHYDNNANNFDDIFGSAPSSPSLLPSSASHGNVEPSDIPRLRSTHSTAGYRDGLTASKGTTIQEGFDEGFGLGATMGLRVGAILGALEGIWAAVAKSEKAAASGKPASTEADLDLGAENTAQIEGERLRGLVIKARNSLRTESVFGTEYWGSDGIWKYDVKEGDNGWNDVVDAHPLIQAWEAAVKAEVDHFKIDTAVLERTDVKRLVRKICTMKMPKVPRGGKIFGRTTNNQTGQGGQVVRDQNVQATDPNTQNGNFQAKQKITVISIFLGAVASIGGFIFGYESGEISGFLAHANFLDRFGENGEFSAVRQGTIVGLLSIGTLIGCLISAPISDRIGRKYTISFSAFWYIIGVIIEISSTRHWVQFAMGRFTAGLGIGALSTCVPMYQSESTPKAIRGAVIASYQLAITLGIWTAYMINYGTNKDYGADNSAQWRITTGIAFLWALFLGCGILVLPESPRWAYRMGRSDEARRSMARLNGVAPDSPLINDEIQEVEEKLDEERQAGKAKWYEVFTGPRMAYRTILGMVLQAGQQLTGANFFFYYGTTIFLATGIDNSYITSIILGSVNVASTIVGLWVVKSFGRRPALMAGAAWMTMCLFVFAFVGEYALDRENPTSTPTAGKIMIAFTCLFIAAFATTWGPIVWTVTAELYPARYRATCIALATSANWLFNFLISFFTTFITDKIHYFYGLVFGGCTAALFFITYFFVIESKDRSLEEIDTMYVTHVNPITSAKWKPGQLPEKERSNIESGSIRRERTRTSIEEDRASSIGPYEGRGIIS